MQRITTVITVDFSLVINSIAMPNIKSRLFFMNCGSPFQLLYLFLKFGRKGGGKMKQEVVSHKFLVTHNRELAQIQTNMTNIKLLCIGLVILTIGQSTYGQPSKFEMGAEGGPSLIFMRGNDIIKKYQKPTIGFSGGLSFQINFQEIFSLRTVIAYERKGSVMTAQSYDSDGNPLGDITTHSNADYLTLPLLVRATFGNKVQYFVNAGPFFGYLLKQTFVSKGDNVPTTTNDNTFRDKRFDTGVSTGIGLIVPIRTKFLVSFEVRNNLGLYNISDTSVVNGGTVKTNSTNFLLSFAYKLGQRTSNTK